MEPCSHRINNVRSGKANADESWRESTGVLRYVEITFMLGFVSISQDLSKLVRCVLVNATYGTKTLEQAPVYAGAKRASRGSQQKLEEVLMNQPILQVVAAQSNNSIADHPQARFWVRRCTDISNLAYLAAIVPGIIVGTKYTDAVENEDDMGNLIALRYASTGVTLLLNLFHIGGLLWATKTLARIHRQAVRLLLSTYALMIIVSVYRLSVLSKTTDSLTSLGPGSLNSGGAKAVFYIFHILPEWSAILLLFGYNTRELCGTGPWGDWRGNDETEKERVKREKKEALQAERRAEKEALRASAELRLATSV
ncbi:hypothetical protein ONZ45_g4350 [Pleurotus djamor]|nr:hypothetical protein ONZ45_g4350 [Pleurotus djamor]